MAHGSVIAPKPVRRRMKRSGGGRGGWSLDHLDRLDFLHVRAHDHQLVRRILLRLGLGLVELGRVVLRIFQHFKCVAINRSRRRKLRQMRVEPCRLVVGQNAAVDVVCGSAFAVGRQRRDKHSVEAGRHRALVVFALEAVADGNSLGCGDDDRVALHSVIPVLFASQRSTVRDPAACPGCASDYQAVDASVEGQRGSAATADVERVVAVGAGAFDLVTLTIFYAVHPQDKGISSDVAGAGRQRPSAGPQTRRPYLALDTTDPRDAEA